MKMKAGLFTGRILIAVVMTAALPAIVFANSGGQPGQFMAYGAGARALGMGGAFFAVADDATAAYWNPAALSLLERKEISSMQASLFEDTSLSFLTYAHPTATKGTWALSVTQLKSDGFEKISVERNPGTGDITDVRNLGNFDSQERAFGFSWGRNISDKMSFGFMIKNMARRLDDSSDSMNALDLAMMRKFGSIYRMAFGIQNIFSMVSGDTDDKLPLTIKIGNAWNLFKGRLVFGFDLAKPAKAEINWRFGGEYWVLRWFGVRFGVLAAPELQEADFGFGLRYRNLGLDIAQGIHALGTTTRFSFSLRVGKSIRARHDKEVRIVVEQAFKAFRSGNFTKAVEKLHNALAADPGNNEIKRMLTRLQMTVDFMPKATGGEETAALIRRGVIAYVDGKDLRAGVNALRHAFNKNPRDDRLLSLLNAVEREAGVSEITRKPEGPEIFTFIDQKIYDSRQAVYDGKYDLAIRRSQDILDLEPNNETALEIMGSTFFLMDQKEKAKVFWNKVLEINPQNEIVRKFLKQAD